MVRSATLPPVDSEVELYFPSD
eukprot:SAG31_NODE_26227_length_446_cov_0.714697_1_plen_21_part_01